MSEGEKSARKMLEEMGFDGAAARQALIESGGDLMKALELLALSSTDKDANAALEVARQVEIQERAAEEKLSEETIRKLQKMEEIGAEKKEKVAVGKGSLVRAQSEDSRELEKMEKNLAGKGMDAETRSLLLIEHMQMLEEKKEKEKAEKETRSLLLIAELQMLEEKKEKEQAEREARDLGMALQLEEQNEMERKSLAVAREMEDKQMIRDECLRELRKGRSFPIPERNALILDIAEGSSQKRFFECSICLEEKFQVHQIFVMWCKHYACIPCYQAYLEGKIKEKVVNSLTCIQAGCKCMFKFEDVRDLTNKAVLEQYQKCLSEEFLAKDKNVRWCPKGCGEPMIGQEGEPMMICPNCHARFCFNCGTSDWHDGFTCEAFKRWRDDNKNRDSKFDEYLVKSGLKMCPNCQVWIEKNGGCDHMHCYKCGRDFNWSQAKGKELEQEKARKGKKK